MSDWWCILHNTKGHHSMNQVTCKIGNFDCKISMCRRPVQLENSPGVATRAGVEAEGRNVGLSDHEGRFWRFHRQQACGNPIPI